MQTLIEKVTDESISSMTDKIKTKVLWDKVNCHKECLSTLFKDKKGYGRDGCYHWLKSIYNVDGSKYWMIHSPQGTQYLYIKS